MKKLLVLSVLAMAAVACGGGDKPATDPSATTNTTGTPDPSKAADPKNAPATPSTGAAPAVPGTGAAPTAEPPKK